jgi:hypothetical protein
MPQGDLLANIYCVLYSINEGGGGGGGGLPDQTGHAGEFLTTDGTNASWTMIPGGGNVTAAGTLTANQLVIGQGGSAVAVATTATGALTFLGTPSSANLRALVTDESGTGALLFANGAGGAFTVTTLNGLGIVAGNAGKTLTVSNTLTIEATDGTTLDIGNGGVLGSMAYQVANGVAITGGAIDGTDIGLTTRATGLFTGLEATGATAFSANGAASVPATIWNGAIFTGGTGTTNFPHLFVQPSGATSATTWSTSGTAIGVNAATGFAGNLIDLRVAGLARFSVNQNGNIVNIGSLTAGSIASSSGQLIGWTSRSQMSSPSDGNVLLSNSGVNDFGRLQFGGSTASFPALKRSTTGLQARLADDSAFTTFACSQLLTSGFTVGTLPAGTTGARAYVTDATAPTYLGALVGGGAVTCPVFYNGAAWVSA